MSKPLTREEIRAEKKKPVSQQSKRYRDFSRRMREVKELVKELSRFSDSDVAND